MTFRKCYERYIVSLFSYRILGVFLPDLLFYNLKAESDAWDVLRALYILFS